MLVDLTGLQDHMRAFAAERDWEQHHTVRNLMMALAGEVGELLAVMQWRGDDDLADDDVRAEFESEVADVTIYLAQLAAVAGVDIDAAVRQKMAINATRFPPTGAGAAGTGTAVDEI